jgi:hypothetical protein
VTVLGRAPRGLPSSQPAVGARDRGQDGAEGRPRRATRLGMGVHEARRHTRWATPAYRVAQEWGTERGWAMSVQVKSTGRVVRHRQPQLRAVRVRPRRVGLAVAPDGESAYALTTDGYSRTEFDLVAGTKCPIASFWDSATNLAVTDQHVFVLNPGGDEVWVVGRRLGQPLRRIRVGRNPAGIAVGPCSARALPQSAVERSTVSMSVRRVPAVPAAANMPARLCASTHPSTLLAALPDAPGAFGGRDPGTRVPRRARKLAGTSTCVPT